MAKKSLLLLAIVIVAAVIVGVRLHRKPKPVPIVKPIIATQPATQAATRRAPKPVYPTYMEVIRKHNPMVATSQPLDFPLDLPDAAHLVIHDPVYLDAIGNLWITRSDGEPTAKALATAANFEEHIIQDRPVFVHWMTNDIGAWTAVVVVRAGAGYDIITEKQRRHLADDRPFRWASAFTVQNKIVVTTDVGVDIFTVDLKPNGKTVEHYHLLPDCDAKTNPPVTMLDTRGVLAWSPWENGKSGSSGVSRFVDDDWHDLPAADWPGRPIQLSMLLDGSVLRLAAGTPATHPSESADDAADRVQLSIGQLDATQFDDARISLLVTQLSDPDHDVRQAAFDELARYGPAIAPKLEKMSDDQLPEGKMRIRQLLRGKITPALAGLTLVEGRLDIVKRCADGTVILFAPAGVEIPSEHDDPDVLNPAWLAMRGDGRMEHPLPPALIFDQKPEACSLRAVKDEWIVEDDELGPRRFVGGVFEPLLQSSEKRFTQLIGIGTRHRWIFRDPAGDTLIIDPLIADPTPKLPVWKILVDKGAAGWDAADFPVESYGDPTGNFELQEAGWKVLAASEKVMTEKPAATQPTALLITPDGTRYFDCTNAIVMQKRGGEKTTWPLPAEAVGSIDPVLMRTADGLLFLYNQPGKLLRIRPTPADAEPFKIDAVFTTDIPNDDHPARVWLDPAGRIDFITDGNLLTVAFPAGHIPKEISQMMLQAKP